MKASQREIVRHRREIGKRITTYREAKGWSLSKLAREVGVQPPTAWGWERGDFSPGITNLRKVADVLGRSVDDLVIGQA